MGLRLAGRVPQPNDLNTTALIVHHMHDPVSCPSKFEQLGTIGCAGLVEPNKGVGIVGNYSHKVAFEGIEVGAAIVAPASCVR